MTLLSKFTIEKCGKYDIFCWDVMFCFEEFNLVKKSEVIMRVADVSGLTKYDSSMAIKALVKVIQANLKNGEIISLSGLGSFRVKSRKAVQGRNPKTGEIVLVSSGVKVSFKPTTTLKKIVDITRKI